MTINCIAIDDEPLALDVIDTFSAKIPFLNLEAVFKNPLEAVEYLNTHEVNLIFLDIEMEELSGIQFLRSLKNPPNIIFTTAHENYALQGFELEAIDYLLKPFLFERFVKAVDKVYKKMLTESPKTVDNENKSKNNTQDYFFVKTGFQHQKIFFSDILYIEGQGDYLKIVTRKGNIMTLLSFKNITKLLPAGEFIRVHKSYMISIRQIDSIERNRIKIGNTRISVSGTYSKSFFEALKSKGFTT